MRSTSHAGRVRPVHPASIAAVITTLSCCALTMACTAGDGAGLSSADPGATVTDSGGVEIVVNRGAGWDSESAWRLEPDLQVGELDGPLAFGRINWVTPGPNGGMLVLDGQSHLVHVFDSVGQRLRSFGGEGDGPGEFRGPAAVTALSDGRLTVSQGFPPLVHWLTKDGDYLKSTRLPVARDEAATRTVGTMGAWQVTPAGRLFVQTLVIDPSAGDDGAPVLVLEVDPDGEIVPDTVASWIQPIDFANPRVRMFEPTPTWMPRSDGVVVLSTGSPYEIQWHDPSLGLQRVTRRDVASVPVTELHRERAIDDIRETMAEFPGGESRTADLLERTEFESTVPEVLRVWVSDPDGRLWIGVHDVELFKRETEAALRWDNTWDVFESDGRYLGQVPIPEGFTLRVVTEDALYGVWEDEMEVPFARRYRVIRPAGD